MKEKMKEKLRVLYFVPHLNTIYAGRTIYAGYKDAFEDMGHTFRFLTANDRQEEVFNDYSPHIFFVGLSDYHLKFLDLESMRRQKKLGMKVFVHMPFWKSPISKLRVNENPSLSKNDSLVSLIKSRNFGDAYYNSTQPYDERMRGFERGTGYKHHTIPLAANKLLHFPDYEEKFEADVSFIGTNLPGKREFFESIIFPLKDKYDIRFYGQGWTRFEQARDFVAKVGMYFNIPHIRDLQRPSLELEDERKIYTSSLISINVHEKYQREFGGDCNERTFKIPISGGFEISDDVACIHEYFDVGKEIVVAKSKKDWQDKLSYYINNPDERQSILDAGKKNVLRNHTYHNRVEKILNIYRSLNG